MMAVDAELYLKPILISHAGQGQVEVALALLKDAKEAQMAREASHSQASTSSGKAPAVHRVLKRVQTSIGVGWTSVGGEQVGAVSLPWQQVCTVRRSSAEQE